ncbi:alpha/beta hydrolase [Bosea sp. (in: a-proteobacteria)]|uniref:alpha/beta hydrolase n=1 Tax=Bosea sp. (in: a-proteobacteria) TaxID=1871050 RepID=UPI0027344D83|nr:alpha/beta hydrolase [Bosea sp. (in: a-proteobacteria)]MDP3256367.1 alpha/beta hydrolase [Bosea sp. (in: a-proteobacteria)]
MPSQSVSKPVYLHYTQEELDRCYDQRVWAPNAAAVIARYDEESARARAALRHHADVPYGAHPAQRLDLFPPGGAGAPVHLHLHGGAWRALDKEDVSFVAPPLVATGALVVIPGFSNLPEVRLPDIVAQLREAVAWVWNHVADHGGDRDRITISGHSSGAHLAAVLLTTDWEPFGLPDDVLKGGFCLSGSYDLGPVMLSSRRLYIDIDAQEEQQLSPLLHVERLRCPVIVGLGEGESPEFRRQGAAFATAVERSGGRLARLECAGLNHFEVALELADARTPASTALEGLVHGAFREKRA